MPDLNTKRGFEELAYHAAKCFELDEVPLYIATSSDQDIFASGMAKLLGGRVIRSREVAPLTRFLESLDHLDYVFLRFEPDFSDDLYLLARDYALDRNAPLVTRLGEYEIHPDHRLAILIDSSTWHDTPDDLAGALSRACTLNYVSRNEQDGEARSKKEARVFDSIEEAIEWCDRLYANGHFLFRGQTQDWPLTAPIHRLSEPAEHKREADRTLHFLDWLLNNKALLDGVELSEDDAVAVAQHHGLKTPLLDVSRNARVAAFFSTHGADLDADQPGIIYVFHEDDLKKYMDLDDELGEKFGRGLLEPVIKPLRRIRHQQGLFFESRPWLIQDLALAELRFRQKPRGVRIEETFTPPREFIYPPLSALEKVVETYLLVEDAIGTRERDLDEVYPVPEPSFDSAGLAIRAFLDELGPKPPPPLSAPHQTLDAYAGVLALSSSHLLVHRAHYLTALLDAGKLLREASLTPELFVEVRRHLVGAQNHMNEPRATNVSVAPRLSIRDLIDGLAIYLEIRSGNPEVKPAQFDLSLSDNYARLRQAYACADHWLGGSAWDAFPIAASFALSCRRPIPAYLDAIVEIGKQGGGILASHAATETADILAQWTGYDPIVVEDALGQIPLPAFHQRPIDRLKAWREEHPDRLADFGPFLFKQRDPEIVRELMPQLAIHEGYALHVLNHDKDLAEVVHALSLEAGLLEGCAGLEATMRCSLTECPFHRFRICGRVPEIPEAPDACKHRENLETSYELTPEQVEAFTNA